jgi:hypothetical protein
VFEGAWNRATQYELNDVVTEDGSSWAALQSNQNVDPAADGGNNWNLMAARGDTGATGPAGPQGAAGPTGPEGPIWESPCERPGRQGILLHQGSV